MRFEVLGPIAASVDGREVELGTGRHVALLAVLVSHIGDVVSSDRLIDDLWSGNAPTTAAKVVQGYVSQLRRVLPPDTIATRGSGYVLAGETDVAEFERLLADSRTQETGDVARTLHRALSIWRGDAYADVRYDAWAQIEIARLEELRLVALEERLDADLRLGESSHLVPELEALVGAHPLRERLRVLLMLALYRSGRQAEALDVYADVRRRLVDELGVEPGPELQDMQRRVLAQDAELGTVRRPFEAVARRARWIVAAGVALIAAASVGVVVLVDRGTVGIRPDSLALLDGRTAAVRGDIGVGSFPSQIAIGAGGIWVLNADDNTVSEIDPVRRRLLTTFSVGLRPVAIAAGAEGLWIANGTTSGSQVNGTMLPGSITRLDPVTRAPVKTVTLPSTHTFVVYTRFPGERTLVTGGGSVWTVAPDEHIVRIDARTYAILHRFPFGADSLAFGGGELWVLQSGNQILRIDPRTNRVDLTFPIAAGGPGIAYGFGSAWVADPVQSQVWRVYPGVKPRSISIPVPVGATAVTVAGGGVWAASALANELARIDPATNRVDRALTVANPQDLATAGGAVLVTTAPAPPSTGPLPAGSCGPLVYGGKGKPRFIVASDLALQGDTGISTRPMQRGIEEVIRERGFRAGKYTIGYQSCDDSTVQSGSFDFSKCIANARAYSSDRDVIGVVGTYNSGCSYAEIPILNVAHGGPVAMVSPMNTFSNLTVPSITGVPGVRMDPTGMRNFARVVSPDTVQYAADATLFHALGVQRVAVLDRGSPYAVQADRWFTDSAHGLGLQVVRIPWRPGHSSARDVLARMQATGAKGLWVATDSGSPAVFAAIRMALPKDDPVVVTDWWSGYPQLLQAGGRGLDGIYGSQPGAPNSWLPESGRALVRRVGSRLSYTAAYGAGAAELMLDAIARSDGTRASVTKALFATRLDGVLGPLAIDSYGDPATAPVTIFRIRHGAHNATGIVDDQDAVIDRVLVPAARVIPYSGGSSG